MLHNFTLSLVPRVYHKYPLWESVRNDRILSYMDNWSEHLQTLCSIDISFLRFTDCCHRGKLAITCNSNTISRPSNQIYKCKKLCRSHDKYADWFQIPLTLQKLWLHDSAVITYTSKHEYLQQCSNGGSDQPNLSQEAKELLEPLAHFYLLYYLDANSAWTFLYCNVASVIKYYFLMLKRKKWKFQKKKEEGEKTPNPNLKITLLLCR